MTQPEPVVDAFLKEHRLGVLATARRDGSPQQTLIAYQYDGNDLVVSTRGASVKAKNLRRRPDASLCVADGGKVATVYGQVAVVEDEASVLEYNKTRLRPPRETGPVDEAALRQRLRDEGRVVLVLKPSKFLSARL